MRIVALLLSLVLLVPASPAIKRKAQEMTVDELLQDLNSRLIVKVDWGDMRCSFKQELSLSETRREIILKYLAIDKHSKEIEDLPPRYIYHIPIDSVTRVYPYGRPSRLGQWLGYDRVMIRTSSYGVQKVGPIWNCSKKRINPLPKTRLLDEADLFPDNPDDGNLKAVINGFRQLVKLLQEEAGAQPAQTPPPESSAPIGTELSDDNDE